MATGSDRALINCPRCGSPSCQLDGSELYCPDCLYHEVLPGEGRIKGRPSATPSDATALDLDALNFTQTLGDFIEQVPSQPEGWDLRLNSEGYLKMTPTPYSENQEQKRPTVFDVVIAEEAKNGNTYWRTVGVAFPLSSGSGLSLKLHMFPELRFFVKESLRSSNGQRPTKETNPGEDIPF